MLIVLVSFVMVALLHAEERQETAITLDLFKVDSTPSYTKPVALGASLLLPGAGHHFINRDKSALVYITADLLSLSAFLLFNHYASNTMQQAVGYAGQHSGAQGAVTDEEHWTLVGNFLGSDDYNNAIDLNRESASKKITSAASSWYWDDISSQKQFNTMRDQSRSYGVISSFFLGAMILNRIVAFVDVRNTTKKLQILHPSFSCSLSPDEWSTKGISGTLTCSGSF